MRQERFFAPAFMDGDESQGCDEQKYDALCTPPNCSFRIRAGRPERANGERWQPSIISNRHMRRSKPPV